MGLELHGKFGPAGGVCRFCIVSVFCTIFKYCSYSTLSAFFCTISVFCTIFRYMQNCLYTEYPLVCFVQNLDTVFIQFLKIVQKKHANCTKKTHTRILCSYSR